MLLCETVAYAVVPLRFSSNCTKKIKGANFDKDITIVTITKP